MKPHTAVIGQSGRFAHVWRALRNRNYRLFFGGQAISFTGTWMTHLAMSWLVYRLTGSVLLLGVVGFVGQIPTCVLVPVGGVLADRWNRRRILVITQVLSMLQSFALAVLALTGVIAVWQIMLLSVFQGVVNALDIPARQVFVVEMIEDPDDLGNAIALNSSIFNGARLVGPSLAGMLIAGVGEGWCFLVDGISYLPVIAALLAMTLSLRCPLTKHPPIRQQLQEGLTYAFQSTPIKAILMLVALVSLMGLPYGVLMPVFAREILHGGPHTYGFLMGASGLGALAGGLYLASRKSVLGLGRVIMLATGCFGLGLVAFGYSRILWVSLALMLLVGFGMLVQLAAGNTVLQTIVEDDKRGRVMSLYAMAFMGMAPFGSLLAGAFASRVGAPQTLLVGGLACVGGAVAFARALPRLRETIRPIYVKKGIMAEVAVGLRTAAQLSA